MMQKINICVLNQPLSLLERKLSQLSHGRSSCERLLNKDGKLSEKIIAFEIKDK